MHSFFTLTELEDLHNSRLNRETYFVIRDVSHGFFSVARHYGGCAYQEKHYTYMPATDELIRDDVLKWITKRRKERTTTASAERPLAVQPDGFQEPLTDQMDKGIEP